MKALLFATIATVAAVFASNPAQASEPTVLLKLAEAPLTGKYTKDESELRTLSILADGTIVSSKQGLDQFVGTLGQTELAEAKNLISEAAHGEIKNNIGQMVCLAIPTRWVQMTASDDSILLNVGTAPCGGLEYNDSAAAQKLGEILSRLSYQYR